MTDAITPALTAEQWSLVQRYDQFKCDAIYLSKAPDTPPSGYAIDPENRHAIAAVALHGQPFGFTRDDVTDNMYAYVDCVYRARKAQDDGDEALRLKYVARAKRHRELADRIAALLPPDLFSQIAGDAEFLSLLKPDRIAALLPPEG